MYDVKAWIGHTPEGEGKGKGSGSRQVGTEFASYLEGVIVNALHVRIAYTLGYSVIASSRVG